MPKTLFRFVKQVASLAQKLTDAAVMQLSHPAGKSIAGWKHAVLLYLREHMDAEYEEVIDWAEALTHIFVALLMLSMKRSLTGLKR